MSSGRTTAAPVALTAPATLRLGYVDACTASHLAPVSPPPPPSPHPSESPFAGSHPCVRGVCLLPTGPPAQHKGFSLEVLDEAFTSEHWIVRIYKVKKPSNTIATPDAPSQHPSKHKKFGQIDTGVCVLRDPVLLLTALFFSSPRAPPPPPPLLLAPERFWLVRPRATLAPCALATPPLRVDTCLSVRVRSRECVPGGPFHVPPP